MVEVLAEGDQGPAQHRAHRRPPLVPPVIAPILRQVRDAVTNEDSWKYKVQVQDSLMF